MRARTVVDVSIDSAARPFAVSAAQTLRVGIQGDYFFVIGAPVLDVEALPGSASVPGLRSTSIIWQGFNPLERTLGARAALDPAAVAPTLPLRVIVHGEITTFVNETSVATGGFAADAEAGPLRAYLAQVQAALGRGDVPPAGGAQVTTTPRPLRLRIAVPLRLSGTVGGLRFAATVRDRLSVHATGPLRVEATVVDPQVPPTRGLDGRELVTVAQKTLLTYARARQYRTFLGNPDPTGTSDTVYRYRTAARPAPPAAAVATRGRGWGRTLLVLAGVVVAAGAGLVVWSRA